MVRAGASVEDILRDLKVGDDNVLWWGRESIHLVKISTGDLSTWLYSRMHIRNEAFSNTVYKSRDDPLAARIASTVMDPGVAVRCTVSSDDGDNGALVEVHRLRIRVRQSSIQDVAGVQTVRLPAFRPNLTPGFFMLVQDAPEAVTQLPRRYYLPCAEADEASAKWKAIIPVLLEAKAGFRAKVLSVAQAYPRSDAIVVYGWDDSPLIENILRGAMGEWAPTTAGSYFCDELAENLYTAESPATAVGSIERSFGEHRSRAIADAILLSQSAERPSFESCLRSAFERDGIDSTNSAANAPVTKLVNQ